MLFNAGVALLFSSLVAAQYGGYGGGSTPTSTTSGGGSGSAAAPTRPSDTPGHVNVDVNLGGNFSFTPPNITAGVGTQVTFWFPNNAGIQHSVTQSSFENPCTYLAASSNNSAGFDSGLTSGDQFTITITNASEPIWFHCKFPTHCGLGMVGSINAQNSSNTFDAFLAAAKAVGAKGEPTESGSAFVSGGFNAVASAAPSATASGATGGSTGAGMKAGISLGALFFAALVAIL